MITPASRACWIVGSWPTTNRGRRGLDRRRWSSETSSNSHWSTTADPQCGPSWVGWRWTGICDCGRRTRYFVVRVSWTYRAIIWATRWCEYVYFVLVSQIQAPIMFHLNIVHRLDALLQLPLGLFGTTVLVELTLQLVTVLCLVGELRQTIDSIVRQLIFSC